MELHSIVLLVYAILVADVSEALVLGDHNLAVHNGLEHAKGLNNEWTVEIEGGPAVAQLVALEFGYIFEGEVLGFPGIYVFRKDAHAKDRRGALTGRYLSKRLASDHRVNWVDQLFDKNRVKRDIYDPDKPLQRVKRLKEGAEILNDYNFNSKIPTEDIYMKNTPIFNDELWNHEWYLQDTRSDDGKPRIDLNVLPVYYHGINGSGVRISILDDGIEHTHTDLRDNYDPDISWDANDSDPDPSPRQGDEQNMSHGTRCAGEIAMTANNFKCGVGVAWGAKIGGVRMLDGRVTDRVEGEALGYAWDKVDIYSASWGPSDDGKTLEGPGRLAAAAIYRGITKGRGGKGTIYVWANGNGGSHQDNCNCDGYSSSIYTISIGSVSQHGLFPWYGEMCASTLATAYSSGTSKDQKISTTDTRNSCTQEHTGTSAAAPLAAGIIALALQANPYLTWRDVQHLIVWTSEYTPLVSNEQWQINNAGLRYDIRFGFGLLNAGALVSEAINWKNVPQKTKCDFEAWHNNVSISSVRDAEILFQAESCSINFIEHVEVIVNIKYPRRGALEIYLVSPHGTTVQLISARPLDTSTAGFVNWPLTSVATWGETSRGEWKLKIFDRTIEGNTGVIGPCNIIIHGTIKIPEHAANGPRKYKPNYNNEFDSIKLPEIQKVDENNEFESLLDLLAQPKVPGQHNSEDIFDSVDPTILAEVEKELLRIHHRMAKYNSGL